MTDQEREDVFSRIRSQRCLVCSKLGVDVAHVKTRGSGGLDDEFNLMPLCRAHHTLQHAIGILSFVRQNPVVAAYLETKGWTIDNGKLWNDHLGPKELEY